MRPKKAKLPIRRMREFGFVPSAQDFDSVLRFASLLEGSELKGLFSPGSLKVDEEMRKITIRPMTYGETVEDFITALYHHGFMQVFDWGRWLKEAEQFYLHPETVAKADRETCIKLLTFHVRKDRFVTGHLADMIYSGQIAHILERLKVLRESLEASGPIARNLMGGKMQNEDMFSMIGFDESLRSTFEALTTFIQAKDGCDAKVYKPFKLKEARAAHFGPAEGKNARQVFVLILPRSKGITLERASSYKREGKPRDQWRIHIHTSVPDWERLKKTLKEWSLDPKPAKKPKPDHEFGDGVALPGGLPETNHAKF